MFHTTCMGPITRSVIDAALYLDCVAGYHPADAASLPKTGFSYMDRVRSLPGRLRVAFSMTLGYARVESDVRSRVTEAVRAFEEMGHSVEEWREPFPDAGEAWSRITDRELYGMLHRSIERNRSELGRSLVAGLDKAATTTLLEQIDDQKVRTQLNRILWEIFERFDLLLTPTMPTEPFAAGGPPPSVIDGRPVPLLGATPFTYPFNLSGHPAASVPAGFGANGLPVGLQIVGPRHREDLVLQAAHAYEEARPWKDQVPAGIRNDILAIE
jgi:aspartyl-tRNA(Asn)/glutamyl-tRNA(Gln) amidotransferase subunit A